MYKFKYPDAQVKTILSSSNKNAFWDPELTNELAPVLEALKNFGEVEGANVGIRQGVEGLVYELRGRTFQVTYTVDTSRKEVRIYNFRQISHLVDWKMPLSQNVRSGEKPLVYIPQISDPQKIIRTVQLIRDGINTSQELGIAFDGADKNDKTLARMGSYLCSSAVALGLAVRHQIKKRSSITYILTDRGNRIAQSNDQETRERLLAEALLGFYPIRLIIEETTRSNKEITKELIQKIISEVSDAFTETTNARRANSLRALVNWVTRWAGIPIRREGNDGVQVYIPFIYYDKPPSELRPIASGQQLRPFGLCRGEFTVPDDFDDPLPEDILSAFEGK
jgi:hypothetical protein